LPEGISRNLTDSEISALGSVERKGKAKEINRW
jgi:hypothetical protein